MYTADPQLTESIEVGPDVDVESWRLNVPGRAACYLLEDGDGRPIIAATVGDLRSALVRRLGHDPEEQTHRKIDYRQVTRRVRWRPVFSRFEGNWTYLELVRDRFPRSYRKFIGPWRAWWVGVDPAEAHPRFEVKDKPFGPAGTCYGPFPIQKAARRYVQMLEDLFDLCRYHHILVQEPHAQACAYKQMGRCPAPCDGSITMAAYRNQIAGAVAFLTEGHAAWRAAITAQMKAAAGERAFERASRLKAMLDASRLADAPQSAMIRPLAAFRFVSLQRGDRKGRSRVFVIHGGTIECVGQLDKSNRDELLPVIAERIAALPRSPLVTGDVATERIGLVVWHLLGGKREKGVFIQGEELPDAAALAAALDAFTTAPTPEAEHDTGLDVDTVSSEPGEA